VRLSEQDKSIVDLLISKHPKLASLQDDLDNLFPAHDRLLIEVLLIDSPGLKITEHRLLLYGLIVRSKGLLRATLREIVHDNKPAVSTLLRAQCENLAAVCYVEKFPDKMRNVFIGTKRKDGAVEAPNLLTQVKHADKKHPGLARDYDQLSDLSHPTPTSHTGSVVILDEKKREIEFSSEPMLRPGEAETCARLLNAWTKWFLESARSIHNHFAGTAKGPDKTTTS
jgi:hypothetical protein